MKTDKRAEGKGEGSKEGKHKKKREEMDCS
jgi:hypothetical protein